MENKSTFGTWLTNYKDIVCEKVTPEQFHIALDKLEILITE
tara:strand:+ start:1003 stop:1125 length:123 start_codon:yes stop_codon:yes gene_type:complete